MLIIIFMFFGGRGRIVIARKIIENIAPLICNYIRMYVSNIITNKL